jgi:hypothetical protein
MECEINSGIIHMRLFINIYLGDIEKIEADLSHVRCVIVRETLTSNYVCELPKQ